MPRRICDSYGKEKDISGGKTCENGQFICSDCVYGSFFDPTKLSCPLCRKALR